MLILMSMHETLVQWECLRIMILDGPEHSHSFFFFWGKPEDPEKNPLTWALQITNSLTSSFFDLFFFYFPPYFLFSIISFVLFSFLTSSTYHFKNGNACCSLKLSKSLILSCTAILWGFLFPAPPFSLFDNPVRHVLFFGLTAPLSFVFLSRSQNTYCLMVCISEYVSEDKLFMCRI